MLPCGNLEALACARAKNCFEVHRVRRAIDRSVGVHITGPILGGIAADVVGIRRDERDIVIMNGEDANVLILPFRERGFGEPARITFQVGLFFLVGPHAHVGAGNGRTRTAIRGKRMHLPFGGLCDQAEFGDHHNRIGTELAISGFDEVTPLAKF